MIFATVADFQKQIEEDSKQHFADPTCQAVLSGFEGVADLLQKQEAKLTAMADLVRDLCERVGRLEEKSGTFDGVSAGPNGRP